MLYFINIWGTFESITYYRMIYITFEVKPESFVKVLYIHSTSTFKDLASHLMKIKIAPLLQ